LPEGAPSKAADKVPICTQFESGECKYAERCRFAHGDTNEAQLAALANQKARDPEAWKAKQELGKKQAQILQRVMTKGTAADKQKARAVFFNNQKTLADAGKMPEKKPEDEKKKAKKEKKEKKEKKYNERKEQLEARDDAGGAEKPQKEKESKKRSSDTPEKELSAEATAKKKRKQEYAAADKERLAQREKKKRDKKPEDRDGDDHLFEH